MKLATMISSWKSFWFESFDYNAYRLFQIIFCTSVFFLYAFRFLDYDFLFSDMGILPFDHIKDLNSDFFAYIPLEYLAKNIYLGKTIYILFLLGLLLCIFNLQNRFVLIFLLFAHIVFMRRNPIAVYGVDMVASFWFLYMALANPKVQAALMWNSLSSRLLQIQLCIIYAYSGYDKFRGLSWWQGDALWYAFANSQHMSIDMSFLAYVPWLIVLLTYFTIFFEVYFPVLIWLRPIRKYVLTVGLCFHIGIALSMNLVEFSLLMLAPYVFFLHREQSAKAYNSLLKKLRFA